MNNPQNNKDSHSFPIQDSPFIGIALPMGVRSKDDKSVKIAVSLCVNINKLFAGFSSETGKSKQDFYERLQSLGTLLAGDPSLNIFVGASLERMAKMDNVSKSVHPLQYAMGELVRDHGHLALRKDLWKKAFPSCRNINPESRVPNPSVAGEVTQLISKENLPAMMGVMSGANSSAIMSGRANTNIDAPGISEKLKNMREFAVSTAKRAKSDKIKFYDI